MTIDEKQVKNALEKCRILIVEDDRELANNLFELIKSFTQPEPLVVHTMETALKQVLKINKSIDFDLVILDVMLPRTEEQLKKIEQFQMELEELRNIIRALKSKTEGLPQSEMEAARAKRARIQWQIDELVVPDGGIQLVKDWHNAGIQFPILFLTAVGDPEKINRGKASAGKCCEWIIKPAPDEEILAKCLTLLKCR
jgi:DNA-binding response OmpR family regulator